MKKVKKTQNTPLIEDTSNNNNISLQKAYNVMQISRVTGISPDNIWCSGNSFTLRYSYTNEDREVVKIIKEVPKIKKGRDIFFSKESLDTFIEAVYPNINGWPTAIDLADRLNLHHNTIPQYYQKGKVRGRTSMIKRRLHIHPSDIRILFLGKNYNIKRCAEILGLKTSKTFKGWDDYVDGKLMKTALDGQRTIEPYLVGRLKWLIENKPNNNGIDMRQLPNIFLSNEDWLIYRGINFEDTIRYVPEKPPDVNNCKKGMRFIYLPGRREGEIIKVGKIYDSHYIKVRFGDNSKNNNEFSFKVREAT